MAGERDFDIVLWGATGFTGRLVAEHLLRRSASEGGLRWALGGRNQAKLEVVREQIGRNVGAESGSLPILLGDGDDQASLATIAERARVVCSTVGPYALYGSKLVAACTRAGTHYCDLTGEVHWMRRMIDAFHDGAIASGARIVHTCGFDCIPADLGVFFLQREMGRRFGVACSQIKYRVDGFSGGASGGTIASMLNMLEEAGHDPEVRRTMADPYALNPKDQRSGPEQGDRMTPAYDPDFSQWTGPFVMAAVDTRVVRRTNALLGNRYGKGFRYDEATLTGPGAAGYAKAAGLAAGLAGAMGAMAVRPLRRVIATRLPKPGEGPSKTQREQGYWNVRLFGRHPSDEAKSLRARLTGDMDPGYGSTSKMLGESALCLALDSLDSEPGFTTPAAAMGDALIERLEAHAGVRFALED